MCVFQIGLIKAILHTKCSKILSTFLVLFSTKILVIKAGIYKMLVRMVNMEDQDLGLHCLSRQLWQTTSVIYFRTFIVLYFISVQVPRPIVIVTSTVTVKAVFAIETDCSETSLSLINQSIRNKVIGGMDKQRNRYTGLCVSTCNSITTALSSCRMKGRKRAVTHLVDVTITIPNTK